MCSCALIAGAHTRSLTALHDRYGYSLRHMPRRSLSADQQLRKTFEIMFCGGVLDGHRSKRTSLPSFIEVVIQDGMGLQNEVRYRHAGEVDEGGMAIYELDSGLH